MLLETLFAAAALAVTGIEAACVPADEGGYDYLLRVEPDLAHSRSGHTLTSDVPSDARDVRSVRVYVADRWPPAVERAVVDARRRPRPPAVVQAVATSPATLESTEETASRPWWLLTAALVGLFLSLGANAYLGMLLSQMRSRFLYDVEQAAV
jgi:hypothetical protein